MPMITLQMPRLPDAKPGLAAVRALTDLADEAPGKTRELTALRPLHTGRWPVGVDGALTAFDLDARITSGTHTRPKKSTYIYAVWQALDELVGLLHPARYIVVTDAPADIRGCAGKTQDLRHARARLAG